MERRINEPNGRSTRPAGSPKATTIYMERLAGGIVPVGAHRDWIASGRCDNRNQSGGWRDILRDFRDRDNSLGPASLCRPTECWSSMVT